MHLTPDTTQFRASSHVLIPQYSYHIAYDAVSDFVSRDGFETRLISQYASYYTTVMSFATYCVVLTFALALLAEVTIAKEPESSKAAKPDKSAPENYPNGSLQYLNELHAVTGSHQDKVLFLQRMMEVDYLWLPILSEPVIVKRLNVEYFNQYRGEEPSEYVKTTQLPFNFISNMLTVNTFTGSEVLLAMDVLKSGMVCSVLKHVSFQGLMLHVLLTKHFILNDERELFNEWLINMVQLAMNKLTAMDHSNDLEQLITQVYKLLIDLWRMLLGKSDDTISKLKEIGFEMYHMIEENCSIPEGDNGPYKVLIKNINRKNIVEELKIHRTQFTENLREASKVHDVVYGIKYNGQIEIDEDITANHIINLSNMDTMKRSMFANHIQMNFFYLNLPIQTFADSLWITLSKHQKLMLPKGSTATQSV